MRRKTGTGSSESRPAGTRRACPRFPQAGAFTLTEVLISIAIMGVGLTMAAALFPSAIKENEKSFNSSTGTLIAQNGLAIAKAVLTTSNLRDPSGTIIPWPANLVAIADETHVQNIPRNDQHYPRSLPLDPDEKIRGFVLLGRQIGTGVQQLISVSYSRFQSRSVAMHDVLSVNIADDPNPYPAQSLLSNIPIDDWRFFQRGGLVITSEGRFARIVELRYRNVAVVRPQLPSNPSDIWTIVEVVNPNPLPANWSTWPLGGRSPAMSVMVTRTALRD